MNGWPPSITGIVDFRILFILQVVVAASMEISIVAECMCDAEWYATGFTGVARMSCLPERRTSYDGLRNESWLVILTYGQIWELVVLGFSSVWGIQIQQFDLNKPVETSATGSRHIGGVDNEAASLLVVFCCKSLRFWTSVDYLLVFVMWNYKSLLVFIF
jgi:hypothetical protein